MFKLTVFFALVAVAFAAPGFLHGGYGIPAATSYSSRVDIHKPILASYAAPIVKTVVAEPIITKTIVASPIHSYAAAPVYSSGLGLGHGYGGYGGYGGLGGGYGYGVGSLGYGHGLSYGLGYGHGW